jgi:hypothetical protein
VNTQLITGWHSFVSTVSIDSAARSASARAAAATRQNFVAFDVSFPTMQWQVRLANPVNNENNSIGDGGVPIADVATQAYTQAPCVSHVVDDDVEVRSATSCDAILLLRHRRSATPCDAISCCA